MTQPEFVYDADEFNLYVSYIGNFLPPMDVTLPIFYRYEASDLIILTQKDGRVVRALIPAYRVEFSNPHKVIQELYDSGFEEDGEYLVDYTRGKPLLRFLDEQIEPVWELFDFEVNPSIQKKLLTVLMGSNGSFRVFVAFPETFAPSLLTLLIHRGEFISPRTVNQASIMGMSFIARHLLDEFDLPLIPQRLLINNMESLLPTGIPVIPPGNLTKLIELLQEEYAPKEPEEPEEAIEDSPKIPSVLERETKKISLAGLKELIVTGAIPSTDTIRYLITDKIDLEIDYKFFVFSFGKLFIHTTRPQEGKGTKARIREILDMPDQVEVIFVNSNNL